MGVKPEPGKDPIFPCTVCGTKHLYPFQAVSCQNSHAPELALREMVRAVEPPKLMAEVVPRATLRAEKLLLRLLTMVDPRCAEEAGPIADELLEALRK